MDDNFWPDGARLAMSYVVNVEEGSEMNVLHGDKAPEAVDELGVSLRKPLRNFGNESNYLYGIKAGAPRVLSLLKEFRISATFTVAAQSLEFAPDLARSIVAGDHEICSHGWRWVHQYNMVEEEERAFIRRAVASINKTTGARPVGWLSRYLLTENTRRLLIEEGFSYHMDDYSDDLPFWDFVDGKPILIIPYAVDTNDMKMWQDPAYTPRHWLEYAIDTFDWLYQEGTVAPKMMSLGLHLRIIGRPGRVGALEKFMRYVAEHKDVWVATRKQIATHWVSRNPLP